MKKKRFLDLGEEIRGEGWWEGRRKENQNHVRNGKHVTMLTNQK